jgi:hypothetical protein
LEWWNFKARRDDEWLKEWPFRLITALPSAYNLQANSVIILTRVFAAMMIIYVILLIPAIESTMRHAGLQPADTLLDPGQLLPFLTGLLAVVTAVMNWTNTTYQQNRIRPARGLRDP